MGAKSDRRRATDERKKDGVLPPVDLRPAVNNIDQQVPNVTRPVRLYTAGFGSEAVMYHAQRNARVITLISCSTSSSPLHGHSYRVTLGTPSTIRVNNIALSTLPQATQHMHLHALSRATILLEP
jgi:hypothetical protein